MMTPATSLRLLGLKIDVDTYQGMKQGVPRLLATLRKLDARGSFFLSMGPDASGRALLQLVKNPLFLKKMLRTRAASLYGFRTALYGTLLPSPLIGLSFPGLIRDIMALGHDVEFHAWDHRRWQDELPGKPRQWIEDWFRKGLDAYREVTGKVPSAFGAPAWLIDDRVIDVVRGYSFDYLSCTRAKEPFIHESAGLLEIPSDLPCFEETGIEKGVSVILAGLEQGGIHVLPVHAEAEGGPWTSCFVDLITGARQLGYRVVPLREIRDHLRGAAVPTRKFRLELLPGRAAPCAV